MQYVLCYNGNRVHPNMFRTREEAKKFAEFDQFMKCQHWRVAKCDWDGE